MIFKLSNGKNEKPRRGVLKQETSVVFIICLWGKVVWRVICG